MSPRRLGLCLALLLLLSPALAAAQPAPVITTIAGAGGPGFNGDNIPASSAQISFPYGIAVDQATGDLYIADAGNNRIRPARTT